MYERCGVQAWSPRERDLETSVAQILAAGDIAQRPDHLTAERIHMEHWVVAEHQRQTAARNMLGRRERFNAVPFIWTERYDFGVAYVCHAVQLDQVEIEEEFDDQECTITHLRGGKKLEVVAIHRNLEYLEAEFEFERVMAKRESP